MKQNHPLRQIPGIDLQHSERILILFRNAAPGTKLILFGSRAKGNYREGSDIDIAIQGSEVTWEHRDRWLLQYDTLELPWKLDLVVYDLVEEPELKAHIDRVGQLLMV